MSAEEERSLMDVPVSTEEGVTLDKPVALAITDVSAADQRFVTIAPLDAGGGGEAPRIRIVQDWYEEFRDREQ